MKFCGALVFVGMLVYGSKCGFATEIDCEDPDDLLVAISACFADRSLAEDLTLSDPSVICADKEDYAAALQCMLTVERDCIVQLGHGADQSPDPSKADDSVNYMCDNIDNIDEQCYKGKLAAIAECIVDKTGSSSDLCKPYIDGVDCHEEELSSCGQQTKNTMVHIFQDILMPTGCEGAGTRDGGTRRRGGVILKAPDLIPSQSPPPTTTTTQ